MASSFDWVGPVVGTMFIGSMLMGMSNNMNRMAQDSYPRRRTSSRRIMRRVKSTSGHRHIQTRQRQAIPIWGNFSNIGL